MQYPTNYIAVTTKFTKGVHNGIDLGWNSKKGGNQVPIYSVEDGECIYRKIQKTGGLTLHIKHSNGIVSEYAHLSKANINVGDKVKRGQQIANMGGTGIVTGNHLHFGLCKGSKITYTSKDQWLNPVEYLCKYKHQEGNLKSNTLYIKYSTKEAYKIPSEPLLVHNAPNFYDKSVVKDYNIYNGDEVEYYGKSNNLAIIDKVRGYYTSSKFLK